MEDELSNLAGLQNAERESPRKSRLGVELSGAHSKCEMPVNCPGRGVMEKLDV